MDFVPDQLATGRKIRVLTIVDIFSRFSPAVDPRFSYRGQDVVLPLERVCKSLAIPRRSSSTRDRCTLEVQESGYIVRLRSLPRISEPQ
jgi:hypothetical protein